MAVIHYLKDKGSSKKDTTSLCGQILRHHYDRMNKSSKSPILRFSACYSVEKINCKKCLEILLIIKNDELAKIANRVNSL